MSLAVRAEAEELMDADDLDPKVYAAVVADLAKVNVVTLAARPTLGFLARMTAKGGHYRLLDVGFGDGDMLRRIARWGARHGRSFDLVGVDLNPRSAAAARPHTPPAIRLVTGDYADLGGEQWDFVISCLVVHHMTRLQLFAFLRFMEAHARLGWLVNDLHRHGFAYRGYPLLARLARWHPIVRHDGTLSIARSYRPGEWPAILAEAGIEGAEIHRRFPFRLCVERQR
ncbi:methyltransferase domain-containing protein [Sphingomonas sp. NBWT7]|uniref:methyltransferase domain-containing protein n=1 Tax=Sphingomonas sp. NBWT7 TaxID=2596913 RepID=UPI001625746F|nr:methyltransferase domain-containing protein [Sphingomonas sp. NBWT7]QNE32758.1 methyltransferase domain-containing protein [Sphingomonas sp. NBWT7]